MDERAATPAGLREAFLGLLGREDCDWHDVWMLFCDHQWAQSKARSVAEHSLYVVDAPEQWLDDIVHDMLLLLADDVRTSPGLHYDATFPPEHFDRWYGGVLHWLSVEALRRFRVSERPHADLDKAEPDDDHAASHDLALDVQSFIASRPEPLRTILTLMLAGNDRKEIGITMGLSQAAICRLLAPVRVELRRWLDGIGREDDRENVE